MLKEFVEKIVSLAVPTQIIVGDRSYSNCKLLPVEEPLDEREEVSTLTGFADLIERPINGHSKDTCYVNVESHSCVTLNAFQCDSWGHRQTHLKAALPNDMQNFPFGQFMTQEAFIIGLMSLFVDTDDRNELVKLVSSITGNDVSISEDDGMSQSVTVKSGVALKETKEVKRVVSLAPYRTFREIDQPVSQFIFRVKKTDNGPTLAIFEADGGKWQLDAVQKIKAWITAKVQGITIVA